MKTKKKKLIKKNSIKAHGIWKESMKRYQKNVN